MLTLLGILVVSLAAFSAFRRLRNDPARQGLLPVSDNNPSTPTSNDASRSWERQPVSYTADSLGINLPWLDLHNGEDFKFVYNWLNASYHRALIEADFAEIEAMGIRKIRCFCAMEWVFDFRDGAFHLNPENAKKLDHFLGRAEHHGIQAIVVMGDGNSDSKSALDGKFRWSLIRSAQGRQIYADAYVAYVRRFGCHRNILMWEVHNEPYGVLTWSPAARALGITQEQVHDYLRLSYTSLKPVAGDVPVGFSEMEEKEQDKYHMFGDEAKRKALIDDSTDIYSMHFYRASPDQIEDFRTLAGKPKWASELGSYNYSDRRAKGHPLPANNELYDGPKNDQAVRPLAQKLINSGFTLIMPWAFSSNPGVVTHNRNGTHTLGPLALYIKRELTGTGSVVNGDITKVCPIAGEGTVPGENRYEPDQG